MSDQLAARRETFLGAVRDRVVSLRPDLVPLYDVYAGEARFARELIDGTLAGLPPGSRLLEVGGGCFLLSALLRHEGFAVTAIEPVGSGFSHLGVLGGIVLEVAAGAECQPDVHGGTAEEFVSSVSYPFAFSINVMEHVDDVASSIDHVVDALETSGVFRFVCPNYRFPYEPHFNIPTLMSKRLTERWLRRWIMDRTDIPDPVGTWRSLNWITVAEVVRACRARDDVDVAFSERALELFIERAISDEKFRERKGGAVVRAVELARRSGAQRLVRFVPDRVAPVIDCTIRRSREPRRVVPASGGC